MSHKAINTHGLVLGLFMILTFIMTYPAITNLTDSIIGDKSDSLLNAWILAWDVHKMNTAEWMTIFDANIFYPHTNTLAYSEHMLGIAIWAWPIQTIFNNPVLTYNLVFLGSLILSAFGMYLLVLDLTGNKYGAVISALIFSFFPWRFAHLPHIQLQATQWIPMTFLYIHRFFKERSYKNLFLFTLFFILQFLSCGYYGVYLSLLVCLFILFAFLQGNIPLKPLVVPLGLFLVFSGLCIFPVYYPYLKVRHEMGFIRPLGEATYFSADLLSYLCAPQINKFWGEVTQVFWKPEGELFVGLTAVSLAITGFFFSLRKIEGPKGLRTLSHGKFIRILNYFVTTLLLFSTIVALGIFFTGGFSTTWCGFKISATSLNRPLFIMLITGGIKQLIERVTKGRFWTFRLMFNSPIPRFYFWVLLLSFVFSLGPRIHSHGQEIFYYGPYILLHKFFPGFDGLRDPARLIILVTFGLSVLAGYGTTKILARFKEQTKKMIVSVILSVLILFEYASFPIPMTPIRTGNNIPTIYKWLSQEKGDFPILELPLPQAPTQVGIEAERIYFSTYHWKRLVNGYSGYFPPDYISLYQKGTKGFPSDESIVLLRRRGIKYLIIHFDEYEKQDRRVVENLLRGHKDDIRLVTHFENNFVYELIRN